ncbi:MAG: tyrosine--tRNA ligase [Ilumatobacteraceae bacterium]|nr:tyrosine--tRNA ligase [Ilumatobacteraceae bacterium]
MDVARPDLLADLAARGLIHDSTDRTALAARLAQGPMSLYVGFDPTADSLHVGHLVGQLFLRRFQLAGHRPFPLAGGATGMVGDPSGRSDERNLLDLETLRYNVSRIEVQLQRLLDFTPGITQAKLVNNADWTEPVRLLDFLRDVGKFVTVNQMLAKDSVRSRLDSDNGLSFTEFSYSLLQANDFRHLYEHEGVELQAGGSDQWGNIVAGVDLIRRGLGKAAHAVTHPLVTKADGTKFGKSVDGAVWLDPDKTSPYEFRQFWVQVDDVMVGRYLEMFSLRPLEEIRATIEAHAAAPERRLAQRELAHEITVMVHGAEAAAAAEEAATVLFGGDPTTASAAALAVVAREVPSTTMSSSQLDDLVGVLVGSGLATSRGDANRMLQQKAYRANGVQLDANVQLSGITLLHGRYLLLRRGKANHHLVEIS